MIGAFLMLPPVPRYERVEDARMVLMKNGTTEAVEDTMIGVKKCTELPQDGSADERGGLGSSGLRSRRPTTPSTPTGGNRAPGRHRLVSSPTPTTRSIDRVPDIYKRHPRPANLCTRLMRYFFKG